MKSRSRATMKLDARGRLWNLHIAIYDTKPGHPSSITIVLSHLEKKIRNSFGWRAMGTGGPIKRDHIGWVYWRSLFSLTKLARIIGGSSAVVCGECATIISRRSPRKSSRQTGTTPPRQRISLMGKNQRDWQPISDLTGVTKCVACTWMHAS